MECGSKGGVNILLIAVLALGSCGDDDHIDACADKLGVAGTHQRTIESAGIQRAYTVTAPDSALRGEPVPLVLVYHGVLANGDIVQLATGFPEKAAEEGFITVAGDGVEQSWNAGVCCEPATSLEIDDVTFARDIVAAVEEEYCIDGRRIYATGFSNGSAMVFRLICEASDLFAAFAPVAGSVALFPCQPSRARPVEIINNIQDPIVPLTLGEDLSFPQAQQWNGCGEALSTEMPATTATCRVAADCADGVRTGFCAVAELSHVWPGGITDPDGAFRATDHIWDFFDAVGG